MTQISIEDFKKAVGSFATGVAVATCNHDGQPVGMTINSFTSVSLEPRLVLFCIDNKSACLPLFTEAGAFTLNFLTAEQQDVSQDFACRVEDQWSKHSWRETTLGTPVFDGCLGALHCTTHQIIPAGDHAIFIGEVQSVEINATSNQQEPTPLLYYKGAYQKIEKTS